ncbi:phenylalanine ammonia-lyase [Ophiostoma piceae UAMH 11346]|uniref:Phenylalanine ammonia-lyase n=1 Tax=Ophiostoma piceae (strain UAMH 11346) TaxID=1262450 RepID=S3C0G0_OPHP1|nr:phenylalanine ammonia-lyase [Ophiostoma piceae UAMH 11346]
MGYSETSHLQQVCSEWAAIRTAWSGTSPVSVNGSALSIADVVAVSLHGIGARLTADAKVRGRMASSADFLSSQLAAGKVIYGVNTGFGGSADTRTENHHRLQSALVQHLNVGLLLPSDKGLPTASGAQHHDHEPGVADLDMLLRSHALPAAIVRAMMLIRSNSLARGHSAVRVEIVEALLQLVSANMTPVVPLRGSISASGDLSPLSYVAGILEGNPDIHVRIQSYLYQQRGIPRYLPADQALRLANIEPVRLQAKEGLGITNGTAASCAAAALAIHTANQLAVWTQLLTAMGTEALAGTANNYDPFISHTRPHLGQAEAAATIRQFLAGSVLSPGKAPARVGLAQDRYALRTAPQWIGPQLEDLALATRQVSVELNATTDNPLIDIGDAGEGISRPEGGVHHGGNFQAMALTSAMEKTLTSLQNLGRLLFTQSAELIDNSRNRGLPPNLSPDDPSTSFVCKGFDVNMAAYQAELAYLAKPVSSHVQVAEMANQSVNSMALVAARYALEAGEIVSIMAATYIYVLCQALDLRCMQRQFRATASERFPVLLQTVFGDRADADDVAAVVVPHLLDRWDELSHLDLAQRGDTASAGATGVLVQAFSQHSSSSAFIALPALPAFPASSIPDGATLFLFQTEASKCMVAAYEETRELFFREPARAGALLSPATRIVYDYVRLDLNIPLNRGVEDHPTLAKAKQLRAGKDVNGNSHASDHANHHSQVNGDGDGNGNGSTGGHSNGHTAYNSGSGNGTRILGTMASEIYMALRDGRMFERVVAFCEKTKPWEAETGI